MAPAARLTTTPGSIVHGCQVNRKVIVEVKSVDELAPIHGRMPLVLGDEVHARWLAEDCSVEEAVEIIGNKRDDFSVYKVSSYVNKPANNDAGCIQPLQERR